MMPDARRTVFLWSAARVAALYMLFGTAWILASDHALAWVGEAHPWVLPAQVSKRWLFVATSGLVIYVVLRVEWARLAHAEAALAATHQQYRDVVEGSIQGLYVHRAFVVQFANLAFAKIFGFERVADVVATSMRALIDPEELARCEGYERARVAGQPAPTRYEFRARQRDGTPIWVSNFVSVVSWEGQPAILATMVDITEAKRASEEARRAREAQAKAEHLAALGRLAADVAHELRNPLSVIAGRFQLLQRQVQGGEAVAPDRIARHLPAVEEAVGRMRRLVDSMSGYARPHAEGTALRVGEVVQDVYNLVASQARSSRVTLTLDCPNDLPLVHAHRTQMVQILLNLTTNAIEAIAETGREGTVTLRGRTDSGQVALEVADTGPGIPEDRLDEIWDPFYTTKAEGTGLGLSIVRSLVGEQPGAKVTVESVEGRGTVFRVVMPVQAG